MSEILARIRVRETHGIRRFLYPLTFPGYRLSRDDYKRFREHRESLSLCHLDGVPVPFDVSGSDVCFGVSLAPHEEQELLLRLDGPRVMVEDALNITVNEDLVQSRQKRFAMTYTADGTVQEVLYDGVSHLRSPTTITCNGTLATDFETITINSKPLSFFVHTEASYGRFATGSHDAFVTTRTTACKSWIELYCGIDGANPNDEVIFTLPLAITSPTLTCDFGVGGYVFGKLDAKATENVWHTEFGNTPYAKWTVATAGRMDYCGEVKTEEEFESQRWFHLIDSDKALAVAITRLPDACRSMTVRLTHEGDVSIAFKLGDSVIDHADFGVCYHFLNDVPAIAAATNPQSILLPPLVEVLPVVE